MTNSALVVDPELGREISEQLALIDAELYQATQYADRFAQTTAQHLIAAGGKRLRPLVTLLAAQLGDPSRAEVISAAVVVELTHLATLYHDDVMDSAPLRRGAPAAHEVWGNQVAILTGDLLFARASAIVAKLGPQAVLIQAETFDRLCLGQLHETIGPEKDADPVTHYLQVLADKTGSLIATAARFGALLSGADERTQQVMTQYGEQIGLAFQLADDVLDLSADPAATGKTPGTDLREHVPTMPVLLLRQLVGSGQATAADVALLTKLDGDLSSDEVLATVVAELRDHPVVTQTTNLARSHAQQAAETLAELPPSTVRTELSNLANLVVDRHK